MTRQKNYQNDPQLKKRLDELEKEIDKYESELCQVKEKMDEVIDADLEEYVKMELENEYIKYREKVKSKGIVRRYGPLLVGIPSIVCGVLEMSDDPSTGVFELGVGVVSSGWGIYQKTKSIGHKLVKRVNNYFNRPTSSTREHYHKKLKKYGPVFSRNILIGNLKYH